VPETATYTNNYDGTVLTFAYNPVTEIPAWCDVIVSCLEVSSDKLECQELDSNGQINWSFDGTDYTGGLTPDTYILTYEV
jgi:hypothetical protein